MFFVNKTKPWTWKNWSGSVAVSPEHYHEPSQLDELIAIVKQCASKNSPIRIVGAGHSFTPLVATSSNLISLDQLSGIDHIDEEQNLATIWAGTRLKDLGPELFARGYAMENLGDVNEQSVAGAITTGTHGTGIQFGNLSSQVHGVTILTATGDLLEISETTNAAYFEAVRLSLGMLGIIVKVTLKVEKAYQLVGKSYRMSLSDCLHELDSLRKSIRNFEFYWFPYTETVQVKTLNKVEEPLQQTKKPSKFKDVVVENGLFWALSEVSRLIPRTSRTISAISAMGVPVGEATNDSHLIYVTPRLVRFQEMEYCVPADAMGPVIRDIEKLLNKKRFNVHFPIECRYVKSDSIWLSPSYQRDSAYIAIHMYKGMEFTNYFQAIEEIFRAYDGRPHWAKMHNLGYETLATLYPKLPNFLDVREQFDQQGLFLNDYLRGVFQI